MSGTSLTFICLVFSKELQAVLCTFNLIIKWKENKHIWLMYILVALATESSSRQGFLKYEHYCGCVDICALFLRHRTPPGGNMK